MAHFSALARWILDDTMISQSGVKAPFSNYNQYKMLN